MGVGLIGEVEGGPRRVKEAGRMSLFEDGGGLITSDCIKVAGGVGASNRGNSSFCGSTDDSSPTRFRIESS